jgi:hypothetical protein
MHDITTLKSFSDTQLQDMIRNIDKKLGGVSPGNPSVYDMLIHQKDVILQEIAERQLMKQLKQTNLKPINLTDDDLAKTEKENEEQDKQ